MESRRSLLEDHSRPLNLKLLAIPNPGAIIWLSTGKHVCDRSGTIQAMPICFQTPNEIYISVYAGVQLVYSSNILRHLHYRSRVDVDCIARYLQCGLL